MRSRVIGSEDRRDSVDFTLSVIRVGYPTTNRELPLFPPHSRHFLVLLQKHHHSTPMSPSVQKPRVLLTGKIDWAHDEWNALADVASLEVQPCYKDHH